ncbi:hypothetical protein MTR_2g036410 [Medicago truncatula]|uniref:Uncharacterized protein n=1 Tax=Medicago truncatula TaxID=3880 RepID=G7IG55_MEDTR|nr:hypothetical protein MTR_2g036410 [Medicago truncatula]
MFAWSVVDMLEIDSDVACDQLTVSRSARVVAPWCRKQSSKNSSGRQLNRASPQYAYPFPNMDKLVDNSSGFKLLSFIDDYEFRNKSHR